MSEHFITWFHQYLDMLAKEISSYEHPDRMWEIDGKILNSGGNLCTHLLGNLNYFIGTVIGQTGYVRQRDLEFSIKGVPVPDLLQQIEDTKAMIASSLRGITDWDSMYPENDYHFSGPIHSQILRLLAHLGYHLGQLNYHRRLMDQA